MLKDARLSFDSTTNRRIEAFDGRYKSFDERIRELDDRLLKLEKGTKETKVGRPRKDMILSSPEVMESEVASIRLSSPTCPACDMSLEHHSLKSGETYYCTKSRGGCGKIYIRSNGELVEKPRKVPSPTEVPSEQVYKPLQVHGTLPPESLDTHIGNSDTLPTMSKCPACGKRLRHESLKSGETYYCLKSMVDVAKFMFQEQMVR